MFNWKFKKHTLSKDHKERNGFTVLKELMGLYFVLPCQAMTWSWKKMGMLTEWWNPWNYLKVSATTNGLSILQSSSFSTRKIYLRIRSNVSPWTYASLSMMVLMNTTRRWLMYKINLSNWKRKNLSE